MDLGLNGKRVVVTGGSSGLGAEIVRGMLAEGAVAWSIARHRTEIAGASSLIADLSDRAQLETLYARVETEVGDPVDLLINCAGYWPTHYVEEISVEEWERTLAINLTSVFALSRDFVSACRREKRRGVVLNITSQAAFGGARSGHSDYAAAKSGVIAFTRSLAREAASDGIRVLALAPGLMETPMAAGALADRRQSYLERIPLGYIAAPAEVADVAVFLCSERARYMTGTTVMVDGGMTMR